MNIAQDDYIGLVRKLCAAANRSDLPKITGEEILGLLKSAGWRAATSAVGAICSRDHVPTNLYGALEAVLNERRDSEQKKVLTREDWKAEPGCATDDEFEYFMKITYIILIMHKKGEVNYNEEGVTTPLTIDEYKKHGMPQTWSPVLDHFLKGYYQAYIQDLQQPKSKILETYLKQYYQILKNRNQK